MKTGFDTGNNKRLYVREAVSILSTPTHRFYYFIDNHTHGIKVLAGDR